jgi:hypothetical protein
MKRGLLLLLFNVLSSALCGNNVGFDLGLLASILSFPSILLFLVAS